MDQISETLEQVTQTSESGKEISQENYKYVKIVGIPNVINSITSTSPVDKSLLYRLSKIHELKWKVKKVDPEWHPVDQIALMEYQILNLIDEIDCTKPWHDAENKLKYITLALTITNIRKLQPKWGILLQEINDIHLCKCHECSEKRLHSYRLITQGILKEKEDTESLLVEK
jgi:hypothetical protein